MIKKSPALITIVRICGHEHMRLLARGCKIDRFRLYTMQSRDSLRVFLDRTKTSCFIQTFHYYSLRCLAKLEFLAC